MLSAAQARKHGLPSIQPQKAELREAFGEIGTWGGKIQNASLPDYCEVDYVRVYEAKAERNN